MADGAGTPWSADEGYFSPTTRATHGWGIPDDHKEVRCICDRDTLINDPGMTVPGCPMHDAAASAPRRSP
jgi:hypothetical protein